jgi:hypothetical protein
MVESNSTGPRTHGNTASPVPALLEVVDDRCRAFFRIRDHYIYLTDIPAYGATVAYIRAQYHLVAGPTRAEMSSTPCKKPIKKPLTPICSQSSMPRSSKAQAAIAAFRQRWHHACLKLGGDIELLTSALKMRCCAS